VLAPLVALALLAPPTTGSVVQVDRTWTCDGPVDLAKVKVTMTAAAGAQRRTADAVHLAPGCTGRIGRVEITQSAGDGIKVAEGVHDLTIGGGSIRCLAKAPHLHQDGIQVLGGARITFRGLDVDCGRSTSRLINSNIYIRQAGQSTRPPTDVVCEGCTLGGWAAHTVILRRSIRSGVTGSSLCLARFPDLTFDVGASAVDPVRSGNTVRQCGPGQLTIEATPRTVTYGDRVVFDGLFLAQPLHSPVTLERRPDGASGFSRVNTVRTGPTSRWSISAKPRWATTFRARLGAVASPEVVVRVRPLVTLTRVGERFRATVAAARPYDGRRVTLQRLQRGRWVDAGHVVLGKRSTTTFPWRVHGHGSLRLAVDEAPGYEAAVSEPLRL
jgi:hypothetical protein